MRSALRTISITGATLAGLYGLASAACIALALMEDDFKSRYVLLQLPITLQTSFLPEPALRMMEGMSWPIAYLLFGLPTLVALYLLGATLGSLASGE